MKRPRPALAVVVGLLMSFTLLAEDGRDFAGFYHLSDLTDLGEEVRVTLKLRAYNYSGADVTNATITLDDSRDPRTSYGSFPNVSIVYRESVRLSGQFIVPRREYEQWQKGMAPRLRITYSANGQSVERMIEISRGVGEEE